jgi:hypothetical protein
MTHPDHRHIPLPLDTITGITAALYRHPSPSRPDLVGGDLCRLEGVEVADGGDG